MFTNYIKHNSNSGEFFIKIMQDVIAISNNLDQYISSLNIKKKPIISKIIVPDVTQSDLSLPNEINDNIVVKLPKFTKYIKINAYLSSDTHAYFYTGYKTGNTSGDYFCKLLNEKKANHLKSVTHDNYKTPFDHLGFNFKQVNTICYNKKKQVCVSNMLYDKAVTMTLNVSHYDYDNNGKNLSGLVIKVKEIVEK